MLKNAFLAFFNAPGAAPVRTRLRRIKHLQCLIRGETSLSHTSRLFFNSLLEHECRRREPFRQAAANSPRSPAASIRGRFRTAAASLTWVTRSEFCEAFAPPFR